MACFVAPATTAIVTTVLGKKIDSKYHIEWLNFMLWGGTIMLMVEHVISGEIVFHPPFLSALENPADTAFMIHEIITIGIPMTVTIVAVWIAMVFTSNRLIKITSKTCS